MSGLWSYDPARNGKNKGDNHQAAETEAAQITQTRGAIIGSITLSADQTYGNGIPGLSLFPCQRINHF